MQKRISIDLVFEEMSDPDFPEDGPWYDPRKVLLSHSEISTEGRSQIAESLAQSDFGAIELPQGIIEAIGDGREVWF